MPRSRKKETLFKCNCKRCKGRSLYSYSSVRRYRAVFGRLPPSESVSVSAESADTRHAHIECTEDMDRACRFQSNNHYKCGVFVFYSSFGIVCVHVLNAHDIESEESPVVCKLLLVEKVQTAVIQTVKKKELIVTMYTMGIKTKIWVSMQM